MRFYGVEMSFAAAENAAEAGVDVKEDLDNVRSGKVTATALLAECLAGADEDRVDGWKDYVAAIQRAVG